MQNIFNRYLPGYIFLLSGILLIFNFFGILEIKFSTLIALGSLLYGFLTVYVNFNSSKKGLIFLGTISFMFGILTIIVQQYELPSVNELIIPSILFVCGAAFLMQYLDNFQNTVFLYSSILLIFFSILYIWLFKKFAFMTFTREATDMIIRYYPILIILVGINMLLSKKRYY